MIIVNKNEGEKIPYEQSGSKICFDDDLTINLAKREEDDAVHIDICYDEDGALVVGAAAGRRYIAEIDIPARKYTEIAEESGEGTHREPVPLNMDEVTLTLWAIRKEIDNEQ